MGHKIRFVRVVSTPVRHLLVGADLQIPPRSRRGIDPSERGRGTRPAHQNPPLYDGSKVYVICKVTLDPLLWGPLEAQVGVAFTHQWAERAENPHRGLDRLRYQVRVGGGKQPPAGGKDRADVCPSAGSDLEFSWRLPFPSYGSLSGRISHARYDFNKIAAGTVSLISATNTPISAWEPIQDATQELREGCAALEQSLQEIFQEVDQMRVELVNRLQEVEQQRVRLDDRQEELGHQNDEVRRLAEELQQRDADLAETREELQRLRKELEEEQGRHQAAAEHEADDLKTRDEWNSLQESMTALRQELDDVARQRDELKHQVQNDAAEQTRSVQLETQLAEARKQLKAAQSEVRKAERKTGQTAADDCAMTMSAEQLTALEEEREALEAELELVRGRAAELNETVAEQQREIAEQKTELSSELQQLRRLVEKQADLIADRVTHDEPVSSPPVGPTPDQTQLNDPVVNSVMAQFAKLQKDVAQRRRHRQ